MIQWGKVKVRRRYKRGVPCRCRKCGARKTLALMPDDYSLRQRRFILCPLACTGGELRPDKYRLSREGRKNRCCCDHYPFPHRRGSLYCRTGRLGREGWSFYQRHEIPAENRNE